MSAYFARLVESSIENFFLQSVQHFSVVLHPTEHYPYIQQHIPHLLNNDKAQPLQTDLLHSTK